MAYHGFMKLKSSGFAFLALLGTVTGISYQSAKAQVRPIQSIRLVSSPDYHLVHTPNYIYRYDSKSGLTQRLVLSSEGGTGKNIKYDWTSLLDQQIGPAGEAGKYEVVEGTGGTGILVRTDTSSGKTWAAVQTSILNWQEVTPK